MPQFSYDPVIPGVLGQVAEFLPRTIDTLINPVPFQQSTVTVATFPDGNYVITVVGEEGTFTATFVAVASTTALITDGLAAAWTADADNNNIATATSDGASIVTLDFLHAGFSYTVTVASPVSDMTTALIQSATGIAIPLGIGVATDDGEFGRLPTAGDVTLDIWGVSVRNVNLVQQLVTSAPTETEFLQADALSILREGACFVEPEVAVAVNDLVSVRIDGVGVAGAMSNLVDGDHVTISGRWKTATTAGGQLAKVLLNTP